MFPFLHIALNEKTKFNKEKIKQNPEKFEEVKRRDRARKSQKHQKMTDDQLKKLHQSNRKAVTQQRERQNEKRKIDSPQVILQVFKTPQSVSKAKQKSKISTKINTT